MATVNLTTLHTFATAIREQADALCERTAHLRNCALSMPYEVSARTLPKPIDERAKALRDRIADLQTLLAQNERSGGHAD